ncbi:MAG: prepilin-type N-terminal cleavage/methylation domain-containing protein [Bdellovibrionales bacterium]
MNSRGYTLIELAISLAIIGIVATLALSTYDGLATHSRVNRALLEMAEIKQIIVGLRVQEERILKDITGSNSTAAYFQGRTVGSDPVCSTPLSAAPTWQLLGYDPPPTDPWGNCYLLDENEGEFGPADCRFDAIISGGPDKRWEGSGDGDNVYGDDLIMRPPYYAKPSSCSGVMDPQFGG